MFPNLNWIFFGSQKAFSATAAAGVFENDAPLGSQEVELDHRPIQALWDGCPWSGSNKP